MVLKKRILNYLRENPKSTAGEIVNGLGVKHETVTGALSSLKRKGEVEATDSWPRRFSVVEGEPVKADYGITVQDFMDYATKLKREYDELKAENTRPRVQLDECHKKLVRLAQQIVKQNIYGNR
jgi:sugar-specific transcriptional regulator TrmB